MGPVYSFVVCDVDIVRVLADHILCYLRYICEVFILRGSSYLHVSEFLGFFGGLLAPRTCEDIVSLFRSGHQVDRYHRELQRSAALQEQYLVVLRDIKKTAQVSLCVFDDLFVLCRSVAHLHDGLAAAFVIRKISGDVLEHLQGERRRTCREIVNSLIQLFYLRVF